MRNAYDPSLDRAIAQTPGREGARFVDDTSTGYGGPITVGENEASGASAGLKEPTPRAVWLLVVGSIVGLAIVRRSFRGALR